MVSIARRTLNKARDVLDHTQARLFGTKHHEKAWRKKGVETFYWDSRDHPHRKKLIDIVAEFEPDSILEIGCNSGPNVFLLANRFPDAKVQGFDINEGAIEEGKRLLSSSGIKNATLSIASFELLAELPDASFDVLLTDAVLIYAGKDRIVDLAKNMARVARKGIVMVEFHDDGIGPEGEILVRTGYWYRDYFALMRTIDPSISVRLVKIDRDTWDDDRWSKYGHYIIADKRSPGRDDG